jgi:hypothetical protein
MNFQEAEKAYQDLRAEYSAGKLSSTDFEEQVSKLKLQDADGKWWQIGVQSGDWYMHDGQKWSKARPPISMEPLGSPVAPPEDATEAASAPAPAPAPIPGMAVKESRPRVAPRLFSSKPAGREGGLPTPILIAIIAVAALVGLAALIGGFLWISGAIGGTATVKTTPTTVAVVAPPTTTLASFAPIVPTNTMIPAVPVVVTPTLAITPTTVVTATTAAPRATATKKPAATTPPSAATAATATKAPNVPPGIYVTKLQLDPPQPNFGDPVGFKVTILNTTGELKVLRWLVKIFKCTQDPCAADDFRRSFGETMSIEAQFVPGTIEVTAPKNWSTGIGACTYVAQPHYLDPVTQQVIPFPQTNGQPLYYVFKMCQ